MVPDRSQQEALEDQSELIGLAEINFLLVICLLAMVAASTLPSQLDEKGATREKAELVRVQSSAWNEDEHSPQQEQSQGGFPSATHKLEQLGPDLQVDVPVVIEVPDGFPLNNIQFLIKK